MLAHGLNVGRVRKETESPGDDTGFSWAALWCHARGPRFVKKHSPTAEAVGSLILSRKGGTRV